MKIPSLHIILVHGLWGNAGHWGGVISALGAGGYTSTSLRALDLSLESLSADTARLQTEISRAPAPVLLVGHSYGGAVISQATDPKVRGVAYVAGLALDEGESLAAIQAQYPPSVADAVEVDETGYAWVKADKFQDAFCADLSPAALFPYLVGQHVPRATVFFENVTAPAWKEKPAWYLISSKDQTISPAAQEMMAARANAKTVRLDTCHASLLGRPREVAAFIALAARAVSA